MRNFEKNFQWGRITNHSISDGSDGLPRGERFNWNGWSLRISWHQIALWRNHQPIINWLAPWSDRNYTFRKGLYIGRFPVLQYGK